MSRCMPCVASVLEAQARMAGLPLRSRADSASVPERGLRGADARRGCRRRSATASRTWRSAICFSKTCAAIARSDWPAPGLEPLFPVWGIPTARLAEEMIERRPARAARVRGHARARRVSFAGREFDRVAAGRLARTASIRAARTASSTPACMPGRCSRTRSTSRPDEVVTREPFVWRDLELRHAMTPVPLPHRLPDRGDDGDAVSPGRRAIASSACRATPCGRQRRDASRACRRSSAPATIASKRSSPT